MHDFVAVLKLANYTQNEFGGENYTQWENGGPIGIQLFNCPVPQIGMVGAAPQEDHWLAVQLLGLNQQFEANASEVQAWLEATGQEADAETVSDYLKYWLPEQEIKVLAGGFTAFTLWKYLTVPTS